MNKKTTFGTLLMLLALLFQSFMAPQSASAAICDAAQFVADVTIPDGTPVKAGDTFTKTWRLKNVGTCTWTKDYSLVFDNGDSMGISAPVAFPNQNVSPGQTVDLTILKMTAPNVSGTVRGNWKLKNANNIIFGIGVAADKPFWVEIRVSTSSGGGTGYDFAQNVSSATWTNGPGSKVENPKLEDGTTFTGVGLEVIPQNIFNGFVQAEYPAIRIQNGDHFQSIINCEYQATSCYVNFRLDYRIGSGAAQTFWSFNERYEGLYYRADRDLSSLAGQDVKFILRVGAAGYATGDRALWAAPRITSVGGTQKTNTPTVTGTPPTPTKTPVPNTGADRATFVADVTVPDGTTFGPNTPFIKTWRVKNTGKSTWTTAFKLVFVSGDPMSAPSELALGSTVAPNTTVDLPSVNMTSPAVNGHYKGFWMLKNASGALFGIGSAADKPWWVEIIVSGGSSSTSTATLTSTITKTPVPGATTTTPTVTPTGANQNGCDRGSLIADLTIPDGTSFAPNTAFTKTWRIKNIGTCAWSTSYKLVFFSGSQMGGPTSMNLPSAVAPGATIDISVNLTSPAANGAYRGFWQFQNTSNSLFGVGSSNGPFWVDIVVNGGVAGSGYDFAANAGAATWTSGAGTLAFPGALNDIRGFAIRLNSVQLETGATETRPTLLTVPQSITDGFIQGIYPVFAVQSGDRFQTTIGCQFNATACFVTYRLDYQIGSNAVQSFWVFRERYEGLTYNVDLDLSSLAGQNVKFILTVLAAGSADGDNALWIAPRITRPSGATATTAVTATVTRTPIPGTLTATPTVTKTSVPGTPSVTPTTAPTASGSFAVVDVSKGYIVYVRSAPGQNNPLIGWLDYNETNLGRIGSPSTVGSDEWWQIQETGGITGWAFAFFLTEYVPPAAFCADAKVTALLTNLGNALKNSDGAALSALISPRHGVDIRLVPNNDPVNYAPADATSIFTSTAVQNWGPAPASGANVSGTFKDVMQPKLLDVYNSSYQLGCNDTSKAGAVSTPWPSEYTNINFYSVYKPATGTNLDWRDFLVGIEYINGQPYLFSLIHFEWVP